MVLGVARTVVLAWLLGEVPSTVANLGSRHVGWMLTTQGGAHEGRRSPGRQAAPHRHCSGRDRLRSSWVTYRAGLSVRQGQLSLQSRPAPATRPLRVLDAQDQRQDCYPPAQRRRASALATKDRAFEMT